MTITLSVDELRSYTDSVDRWSRQRTSAVLEYVLRSTSGFSPPMQNVKDFLSRWEVENPMPRLFHSILGSLPVKQSPEVAKQAITNKA